MIRHICMFKLQEADKENKVAEFMERSESLRSIPQIKTFCVVQNDKRTPESNYDVALIFDFDSVEELEIYQNSEIHKAFGKFVTGIRESRACIDYEI